jgi:aminoglycoside phosphotransferase (APT) family kinase protein
MDALDIEHPEHLAAYLRHTGRIAAHEVIESRALTGGVSNRTVWVRRASGETWVLKQALEKLRVSTMWYARPERIEREAAGLRALEALTPPGTVPRFVFEDAQSHILAMDAVPEPFENWKDMLMAGRVHLEHARQFGALLATIHRESHRHEATLRTTFADRSFFESLRLEPYYEFAARALPTAAEFLTHLCAETRAIALVLVHGDYSPKNLLRKDGRFVLLDHEVIHWGDPAFDVGFSLAHLLSKAHHLRQHRAAFRAAAEHHWDAYQQQARAIFDSDFEGRAARHLLACLLARVAGRSTLEYLSATERAAQRDLAVALMQQPTPSLPELIQHFVQEVP